VKTAGGGDVTEQEAKLIGASIYKSRVHIFDILSVGSMKSSSCLVLWKNPAVHWTK